MNRTNKQIKKLALRGDTVKHLSAAELANVDGGMIPNPLPTISKQSCGGGDCR